MDAHKNFAVSTVAAPPSPAASGVQLDVQAGEGGRFPTTPFNATVWAVGERPTPANAEIVRVTNRAGDTLTIQRTQEGSSARTIVNGDVIAATVTVKTLADIEALLVDASANGKGFTKLTVAPANAANPLAVGDNDPRMTDARNPTGPAGGDLGGGWPNPTVVSINGRAVTAVVFGDDTRLFDQREPTNGSVSHVKLAADIKPSGTAAAGDEAVRALGHGANQALPGDEPLLPSQGQKNALAGSSGVPASTNVYVTDADPRNSNARTPTAHTHPISDVTNLQSSLDAKINSSTKDQPNGVAGLGPDKRIPIDEMPAGASALDVQGLAQIDAYGHSYLTDVGAGQTGGHYYVDRLARAMGARRRSNRGITSSLACHADLGGFGFVLQEAMRPGSPANGAKLAHPEPSTAPFMPREQIALDHFGINDLAILGSQNPRPYKEALRTIWSRRCAAAIYEDSSAPWPFWTDASLVGGAGSWATISQTSSNSGASIKKTTAIGDRMIFTLPNDYEAGKVIAIGLWVDANTNSTIQVFINGVAQPNAVLDGNVLCDHNFSNQHQVVTLRFGRAAGGQVALSPFDYPATLAAGNTIEVRLNGGPSSPQLAVDYIQIEADPLDGPLLVVPGNNRVPNYQNGWGGSPHGPNHPTDPMNDQAVINWNARLSEVGQEFPNRFIYVNVDDALNKDPTVFGTDGVHPNQRGQAIMVATIREAVLLSGLLTKRILSRPAIEPTMWYTIGSTGAPAFLNSWLTAGATPLRFQKTLDGDVIIRGAVRKSTGGTPGDVIFNLPVGFRPAEGVTYSSLGWNGTDYVRITVTIASNGDVNISWGATMSGAAHFLTGHFRAER